MELVESFKKWYGEYKRKKKIKKVTKHIKNGPFKDTDIGKYTIKLAGMSPEELEIERQKNRQKAIESVLGIPKGKSIEDSVSGTIEFIREGKLKKEDVYFVKLKEEDMVYVGRVELSANIILYNPNDKVKIEFWRKDDNNYIRRIRKG